MKDESLSSLVKRVEDLESATQEPKPRDIWDKISIVASFLSSVVIAAAGLAFTLLYQHHSAENEDNQLKTSRMEVLEKFIPHLTKSTEEQKLAVIAINYFAGSEVSSQIITMYPTAGVRAGGKAIAAQGDAHEKAAVAAALTATSVHGVDVSDFAGRVDWPRVAASGATFAFAKATEGATNKSVTFPSNWSLMKASGLIRGAYHLFHFDVDPDIQARNFLAAVKLERGDLVALDLELATSAPTSRNVTNVLRWLRVVERATGRKPIIYSYSAFVQSALGGGSAFSEYPLWIAQYGVSAPTINGGWSRWTFWQYSATVQIQGLVGAASADRFNGTLDDLRRFAGGSR